MSNGHARLGPSNKRWPECAGSIREEERYPDIAGAAAIDGTGSHLLLELCLQNNVQAEQYDQQVIGVNHEDMPGGWFVLPDRIKRVQMSLDYVYRRVKELSDQFPGATITVEAEGKSDPGGAFGRDDWWGTVDITITVRDSMTAECLFIEVIDYKDGRGYVSEKDNTQLISYLFGKMRLYIASGPDLCRPFVASKVGGCRVTIVQPKTSTPIRYQCSTRHEDNISVQSIIDAAIELDDAACATDKPDAPLVAGKHCQWCKANPKRGGHCTADTDKSLEVMSNMNDLTLNNNDVSLFEYIGKAVADPKSLTVKQLTELADAEAGIQAAFDSVKKEIVERINQGETVPGYAMLPGKGSNKWNAADDIIAKKLKSRRLKNVDIYPPKLISPAQVMNLDLLNDDQKARIKKELITFVDGKKSLQKVKYEKPEKDIELMFMGVTADPIVEEVVEEVSFF